MNETPKTNPIWYIIGSYLFMLLVLTPVVAVAWNLGLEPAGIATNTIDWTTAVGLSIAVMVGRVIMAGASSSVINIGGGH